MEEKLLKYFNMPRKSPLDSACSRVDEVHRSWHLALSEYDNLEGFKSNVNNAIQSLRNITFNIQSQKKELLGFDDWYVEWQERMKNNLILRELQLARNMIVKEKDLEFKSKAIAKIEGAGFDKEILKFAFRPCSDTKKIIYGIYYNYIIYLPIPEEIKSRFIFTCEREWIYDKLPDFELLDAISRAYSFFVKMLKDAGKQFNVSVNFPDSSSYCSNNGLDCMRITKEQRTMSINLLDGINIGLKTIEFVPPEKYIKAAEKRYSALFKSKKITNITNTDNQFTIASTENNNANLTDPTTALGGAALVTPNDLLNDTPVMRTDIETYTVQPGDTLGSISQKFAISVKSILWENKLTATSILRTGQELKILPIDGVTHTVKKGETLQQIANYYKASLEDILDFNDLADANDIYPNDFLIIPAGKIPPPPPPRITPQPTNNDKTILAQKQTQLPAPAGNNCHVFIAGQCTWYVAKLRCIPWTGHAKSWIANARRMGFGIGKTPAVGAIIATNESWYGHVAYVESFDDSTVTFTEMNHLGRYITNERTFNLNDRRIVGYIY